MTDVRLTATNPEDSSVVPVACNAKGELVLEEPGFVPGTVDGDLAVTGRVDANNIKCSYGTLSFAAADGDGFHVTGSAGTQTVVLTSNGLALAGTDPSNPTVTLSCTTGAAMFATNNAGFTPEGYLWCKTRGGDIVVLDSVSNGSATWEAYTPSNFREDFQGKQ